MLQVAEKKTEEQEDRVKFMTTRVWPDTYGILKVLAALRGMTVVGLFDRIVKEEAARMGVDTENLPSTAGKRRVYT